MKNVKLLIEREEIHAHVEKMLRDPLIRRNYAERGFVWRVVDRFADYPKFFFDATDPYLEAAHFATWWGGIQNRTYENDTIADLYLLHEMRHAGTMVYMPDLTLEAFKTKMVRNELDASMTSEIRVYFEIPGLRERSFKQPIFADRFLQDPVFQRRWETEPRRVIEELALRREEVMLRQNAADREEFWIHRFAAQNDVWAGIWVHNFNQVETAMVQLREDCATMGKKAAMNRFMDWLTSHAVTRGTDIPFPQEAEAFAPVYKKNKENYAEAYNQPITDLRRAAHFICAAT